MDATKLRYADFDELLHYCRYSAAPVGRFVLDVHGETQQTWPASDALCAALQIINHIQDCGKDFREIDRVYIPGDMLARNGASIAMLGQAAASPELRAALHALALRNAALVAEGRPLPSLVRDWRLRLETAVIGQVAAKLNGWLLQRDPLSEPVHLSKRGALLQALIGVAAGLRSKPRSLAGALGERA